MNEKLTLHDIAHAGSAFNTGVLSSELFDDMILSYVSNNEQILPNMMRILEIEREHKKELLKETNFELSRSLSGLIHFDKPKKEHVEMRKFMIGEIKKHYTKWKKFMTPTLKFDDLD